jgi:diguanylate cyclase (GGDEF)-like protein
VNPRSRVPARLLQADDLPTIPAVAIEVLRLCREDETTLEELARALSFDPALSARLLRFANSSLFNQGSEVGSLNRAALVLGMKSVQLMALSFSITASLPRSGESGFDYDRYWRRSVVRAVVARSLSGLAHTMTEDEAFLCGLLAELGEVVMARCLGEEHATIRTRAGKGAAAARAEREALGYDHADVAATLLESWQFPTLVVQALGGVHHPEELPTDVEPHLSSLVDVLLAASHLTDLLTGEEPRAALRGAEQCCLEAFEIEPETLHAFVMSLEPAVREASDLLSVQLPPGRRFEDVVVEARGEFLVRSLASARAAVPAAEREAFAHRTTLRQDERHRDQETGLPGRAAFDAFLAAEIELRLSGSLDRPLGCLWLEVDRLAQADGVFGPGTRTELLRVVCAALAPLVRRTDLLARVDGERFALLLSEASPYGLRVLAERLRAGAEQAGLDSPQGRISTSITLGGACLGTATSPTDGAALVEAARRCLERAKARGRNNAVVHEGLLRAKAS